MLSFLLIGRLICLSFHYTLQLLTTVWQQSIMIKNLGGGYQMKIDRLVSIIMILLEKERISREEFEALFKNDKAAEENL